MKPPGILLLSSLAAGALRVWIILGILLRLTRLRDRVPGLSVVFYTTPWPVMAAGFVVLAVHGALRGNRRALVRYVLFTGGALFTWAAMSWQWMPSTDVPRELRVVLWNVSRNEGRFAQIAARLKAQDADILALAEAQDPDTDLADRWRMAFPEYRAEMLREEMFCLVRGEVLSREDGMLAPGSAYGLRRVRVRGREMLLIQVDLYAGVFQSRRVPLLRLAEIVRAHAGTPMVVLGDFNTPRESVHLDALRRTGMAHCFEAAGRGFVETWPVPLPALNLDQVWASPEWHPLRARHAWTLHSDHEAVTVDLRFSPHPSSAAR